MPICRIANWVSALVALAPSAVVSAAVSFHGLGDLSGASFYSFPRAVSADGSVVVGKSQDADGLDKAFRWTAAGGMVALRMPGGGLAPKGEAFGISDDGSVIVGVRGNQAFRWTVAGGMVGLSDLPGGSQFGEAQAVSADASVVVGFSSGASMRNEAFRWTAASGKVSLGDLAGGSVESYARDICSDGSVIVGSGTRAAAREGVRWTAAQGMMGLGLLPAGGTESDALVITRDGAVIAGSARDAEGLHAFRWTVNDGMVALGDLPGGLLDSFGSGISDDGLTIIGFGGTDAGRRAMIWTPTAGMRELQTVLQDEYGLDLNGWQLDNATDISADGRTIIGYGLNPLGQTEAWVANIPEPTSALLVVAIVTSSMVYRRARFLI